MLILEIVLVLVVGTLNIACFFIGAKVGQSVAKDIEISFPKVNPFEIYKDQKSQKEADKECKKLETIMHNIDAYDGTGTGQKDV